MPTITLYGKPGCCLCDEARGVVEALRRERPFDLVEVDISTDPVLHARYGERIPVLDIDGVEAFELGVDAETLRVLLSRVGW
ncbi:MAG: hypothetical protein QOG62_2008 [Thermoleophilaceae bacterium]|nr:hypothetical protein [Thermoleophilaceae bacterium]